MIILVFFGFLHVQFQRINMSIAIIAMTSNQSHTDTDGTVTYAKEFDWDSKERAMVLSAFFYGYFTTQMLGGLLAPMVGAGRLFGLSICLNGLLMLFVPWRPTVPFGSSSPSAPSKAPSRSVTTHPHCEKSSDTK